MHFTELFIRRPVITTLVMLAILLFGAMSYRYLPVSDLPNVDFPTIMVTANLPGASPETMASAVPPPRLRGGEPGAPAGPLPGGDLRDPAPVHRQRIRRHPHGPAHLHDQRGGPGPDLRRAEVRGARPTGPPGPGQPAA